MAGAKRNGADGAWETSGIVEGKEGEAAGVTGEATLFGSNKSFGWGLRDNGISKSEKFSCGGRCGGLVKFLNSDGTIWNENIVSFDIGLPRGSVIRCTLLK